MNNMTPHQEKIINKIFIDLEEFAEHIGLKKDVKRQLHNIKKEFISEFEFIIDSNSRKNTIKSYPTDEIINSIQKTIQHRIDRMDFNNKTVGLPFGFALLLVFF